MTSEDLHSITLQVLPPAGGNWYDIGPITMYHTAIFQKRIFSKVWLSSIGSGACAVCLSTGVEVKRIQKGQICR